jgi:guanyl-specific ribonuclease Sa
MTATVHDQTPLTVSYGSVQASLQALPEGAQQVLMTVYRAGPLNYRQMLDHLQCSESELVAEVTAARPHLQYDPAAQVVSVAEHTLTVLDDYLKPRHTR